MAKKAEAGEKALPKRRVSWGNVGTQTAQSVVVEEPPVPTVVPPHLAESTDAAVKDAYTATTLTRDGGWAPAYEPPSQPAVDLEQWAARNMGYDDSDQKQQGGEEKGEAGGAGECQPEIRF